MGVGPYYSRRTATYPTENVARPQWSGSSVG